MSCWQLTAGMPGRVRRVELGLIGVDRRERLRDGDPVDDGPPVPVDDVRDVMAPGDRDPGRCDGGAVAGRLAPRRSH